MSSIIRATTSSGLQVAPDNSGSLQLQTNGTTTAVTIDTSQNVGIGTSSPSTWGKFAVVGASSGGQVVAAIANTSGTANTQAVLSFDTTNNGFNVRDSQIRATNNGSNQTTLEFYTASATTPAEQMRITSDGLLKFNSGYGSVATAYGCRAWVNFNGTGTPAIRASGNVTSITDDGTGLYTVNFTNSMPDVNYAVATTGQRPSTSGGVPGLPQSSGSVSALTTSGVQIKTYGTDVSNGVDYFQVCVSIFR